MHNSIDMKQGWEEALESILNNVGCAVYVRDAETQEILYANRVLYSTFDEEIREGVLIGLFEQDMVPGCIRGSGKVHHIRRGRWYDVYYTRMEWMGDRSVTLFVIHDITEKKAFQKRMEKQSYTDLVTGLYNRLCCERDLTDYIRAAEISGGKGILLYLDLDDFKNINDGLGHQYGDMLLKAVSRSLKGMEGIENTCYRVGGDEFIIIIPPSGCRSLREIVNGIVELFEKPWYLGDRDYYCTMSMGIVSFPGDGRSFHELMKKADIAMYEAKKQGKNRVAVYSGQMGAVSGRRLDMEKNMRDAVLMDYEEFRIYFQPIIDVREPGFPCVGAEALIRWDSGELGLIPPDEFIPLAEYLGLINPIGSHVLREACRHCKKWNDSGCPDYKVNVNLSVIQLLQADIVESVEGILQESGLNPRNLTLEVTESLAIQDMERVKDILGRIKELGVRIALDDFGTGYSSLNHIRELPLDVIKVDQSFVKDLSGDAYSQSFIRMVGELAETIGVSICVEGIETREQFQILEGMKVRLVQGYYFDRPLPGDKFEKKYVPGWNDKAEGRGGREDCRLQKEFTNDQCGNM